MNITFILTGSGHRPVGGFKVVYEYANRLIADGHKVELIHPQMVIRPKSLVDRVLRTALFFQRMLFRSYHPSSWFDLDPKIKLKWVLYLSQKNISDSDVVIATGWNTAHFVADLPSSFGEKFYLIQHLETWATKDPKTVLDTWKLPLKKIVIARWLQEYANSIGESSCYAPNGLDFNAFGIDTPLAQRQPATVMLLNHWRPYKGSRDGLDSLQLVKKQTPDLRVIMFGITSAPKGLPSWVEYYQKPKHQTLRKLYNEASVFLAPSHTEGWGLTACEAMMCGCALVATDVGGHREFAFHRKTALLVPAKDTQKMSESILELIENRELRETQGKNASEYVQQFTWTRAYGFFISAILEYNSCK